MSEIEHTGYLLNKNSFTFSRKELNTVDYFDCPILVKDLKSFLGLANHFRSVVKNYSILAMPLDRFCVDYDKSKNTIILWTNETIASFNELKS